MWRTFANSNKELITTLAKHGVIQSRRTRETMLAVDRGLFCPPGVQPYHDSPQPIGYNVTISAPHMHAMCLDLMEPFLQSGARVLDVGSGSGYLTACMAHMVAPEGEAYGVEHIKELVQQSKASVEKLDSALRSRIHFTTGDGRQGLADHGPYDVIHVGAAAERVPPALIEQLKSGGVLVIPVGPPRGQAAEEASDDDEAAEDEDDWDWYGGQKLMFITKQKDGSVRRTTKTSVMYVPLTDEHRQRGARRGMESDEEDSEE